jgi:glyoxylase-like metal-dependent hydrolase (beta-lactamase superfamily II)
MGFELREVADGLWLWRIDHPDRTSQSDFQGPVTSMCVHSGGEVILIDPLAPPPQAREAWSRFDADPPTVVLVLKPDHVRDLDLFARRYAARAFGPTLFFADGVPKTTLTGVDPGDELPGGLIAQYDGRGRNETPMWLPEQRTLVFADALTAMGTALQVWATPWYEERTLPALRALLDLPFERVIVSHGEPVHDRAGYERALTRDPWTG